MRRKISTLLIFALIFAIPNISISGATVDPVINVNREINAQKGGIVWYTDTITISAPNVTTIELDNIWIGQVEGYTPERVKFHCKQCGTPTSLTYTEETRGNYSGYLVQFPTTQSISGAQTITVMAEYLFLESVFQTTTQNKLFIQIFPLLEYNITDHESTVNLPPGSKFQKIEATDYNVTVHDDGNQSGLVSISATNVAAYNNATVPIIYDPSSDDEQSVHVDSLTHDITPTEFGISVVETHIITNIGRQFQLYSVLIPVNATNIWVKDHVGFLSHGELLEIENITDYRKMTISARYKLYNLYKWSFTLGYDLPTEIYITDQTLNYPVGIYNRYV